VKFSETGLDSRILESIDAMGFDNLTAVQEKAIPAIIEGHDMIVSAQTGTGKTAAYMLPLIHKILDTPEAHINKALVIVPTRELAVQIEQQLMGFSYYAGISCIAVYGGGTGENFGREKSALTAGTDIVICTPGRMITHLNMNYAKFMEGGFLVLDEADRMLDMGFLEDIQKIISYLPKKRQTLMFSATMPPKIRELARKALNKPLEITLSNSRPPETIKQEAYVLNEHQKSPLVKKILKERKWNCVLVFCSTKQNVKNLTIDLQRAGVNAEQIHSDLEQDKREGILSSFRNKQLPILVATDILSRGIDIDDIELVLNYDVPNDGEDYVHRIGRTARAESKGEAITLINNPDQFKFGRIEALLGYEVVKMPVPSELGEAPLYEPERRQSKPFRGGGHQKRPHFNKRSNSN